MSMTKRLEGKITLITGSGSGIGRSSALRFAGEGAFVIVNDLSEDNGRQTVASIEQAGGRALFIQADVTNADSVKQMVDQAIEACGYIDVLFNNAGISGVGALHEIEPEMWD